MTDAIAIVEDYLAAMGDGRRDDAAKHLAPDAELIFPGGRRYRNLDETTGGRYRSIDKHRDIYESGGTLVYSIGRLFGENNHGVRFDNVRYVDRFRLRDNKIIEQWVWNDLAETGVLTARTAGELAPEWRP
jgi:hypothetical protein